MKKTTKPNNNTTKPFQSRGLLFNVSGYRDLKRIYPNSVVGEGYVGKDTTNKISLVFVSEVNAGLIDVEDIVFHCNGLYVERCEQVSGDGENIGSDEVKRKIYCWRPQNMSVDDVAMRENDFYFECSINGNTYIYTTAQSKSRDTVFYPKL